MTDEELIEAIVQSSEAAALVNQGVKTREELLTGLIKHSPTVARSGLREALPSPERQSGTCQ
jgi:hypothetical protein